MFKELFAYVQEDGSSYVSLWKLYYFTSHI